MMSMMSPEEAKSKVIETSKPLDVRYVSLDEAQGHVIAEDIVAGEPVPAYPASSVDGSFRIPSLGAGRVVEIQKQVERGNNMKDVGSDVVLGEILMKKGEYIGASEIALLAAAGVNTRVPVYRKPTVAVISIGDEIEEPNVDVLPVGKIRDASRTMLIAAVREATGSRSSVIMDLGIAGDCQKQLEEAMNEAISRGADIILTTGRASIESPKGSLKSILSRTGTVHFGQVSMEPGTQGTFGTISDAFVFGLPSNPVSALTMFNVLVYPCIQRLSGFPKDGIEIRARADTSFPVPMHPTRTSYQPVCVEFESLPEYVESSQTSIGKIAAYETGGLHVSSRMVSYRHANALMVVPSQAEHRSKLEGNGKPLSSLPAGTILPVIMLPSKRILGRQSPPGQH